MTFYYTAQLKLRGKGGKTFVHHNIMFMFGAFLKSLFLVMKYYKVRPL